MIRLTVALAATAAAACAPPTPPTPPPAPRASLIGEWQVTGVNGQAVSGKARIVPPLFVIDFGCNSSRSGFRIEGSVLFRIGPMGTTERACVSVDDTPSPVMQREEEGFRIARRPMQVTFYGPARARLSNEAGTIDLSR